MLKEPIDTLKNSQETMISQLHAWCAINSGTTNLSGLKKMCSELAHAFSPIADEIETLSVPAIPCITMEGLHTKQNYGDILLIRKRPHLKRRVLLCGHMDTVYPPNSSFQNIRVIDKNTLNGPGVADMKGGLIVILHALIAFEKTESAQTLGWDVFINADEETGSRASAPFLEKIASKYQAALVYEPAMTPSGTLAKNRKGSGKFTLVATGKSAHAGRDFDKGRNAICHLAETITAIHALNGKRPGITINIGKIAGGDAINAVPDKAVAKLDVRITQEDDAQWIDEHLSEIVKKNQKEGYQLTLHGAFYRPVKHVDSATTRLFSRIQDHSPQTNWKDSGGCCDGNNLAKQGLPVIDTLGVRGGNIHSEQEYILLDSLVERANLSCSLLVDLAQGGLEALRDAK